MALEVFYSYSHKDEALRDKLEKQLSLLRRTGLIVNWHDRRIGAGQEWRAQIDAHVRTAHIILLLISADFIESDYCYDVEMQIALERQAKHEAVVIPVILRPVDFSYALFARLQALPRDGRPITKWANEDDAFADVARSIREVVARFEASAPVARSDPGLLVDRLAPEPRVVDAAIPSHVVKDLGTELLVLIRLPDSPGLRGILQEEEEFEARPEDVRSRPFNVVFPLGPTGRPEPLKVTVRVTSPDFSPPDQSKNIFVPPEKDSEVCPFVLTPRRVGRLTVLVELEWEDAVRGHRSLLTSCVAEATGAPVQREMNLVQMRMTVGTGTADASTVGTDLFSRTSSVVVPLPASPVAVAPPEPIQVQAGVKTDYRAAPDHPVSRPPSRYLRSVLISAIPMILVAVYLGHVYWTPAGEDRGGEVNPPVHTGLPEVVPPIPSPTTQPKGDVGTREPTPKTPRVLAPAEKKPTSPTSRKDLTPGTGDSSLAILNRRAEAGDSSAMVDLANSGVVDLAVLSAFQVDLGVVEVDVLDAQVEQFLYAKTERPLRPPKCMHAARRFFFPRRCSAH